MHQKANAAYSWLTTPSGVNNFKRISAGYLLRVARPRRMPGLGSARHRDSSRIGGWRCMVYPAPAGFPGVMDSDAVRAPPGSRRGASQHYSTAAGGVTALRWLAGCRAACVVNADSVRAWAFRWTLSMLTRC
jgi:hypothetical protein